MNPNQQCRETTEAVTRLEAESPQGVTFASGGAEAGRPSPAARPLVLTAAG
jgi:hypothetical protein